MTEEDQCFCDSAWKPFDLPDDCEIPGAFPRKNPKCFVRNCESGRIAGEGSRFCSSQIFYDTTKGIVLSEMTIYPEGGEENTPTTDKNFNAAFGDQWKLPPSVV